MLCIKKKKFSNISILHIIGLIVFGYTCFNKSVVLPNNRISNLIIKLFIRNNLITGYKIVVSKTCYKYRADMFLEVYLSYFRNQPAIFSMQSISLPSRHIYVSIKKLSILVVKNKQSTFILNTNLGILTGKESLSAGVGGELICVID